MGTPGQVLEIALCDGWISIQGIANGADSSYCTNLDSSFLTIKAGSDIILDVGCNLKWCRFHKNIQITRHETSGGISDYCLVAAGGQIGE